ncbi:MAG: DoxX family protein [Chitinophagaceae bacterium]|nr:DoxX family protein [Chitinophagaceae bacterium]
MKRLFNTQPLNADAGILFLRLILGGLFAYHGYDAVMHYQEYLGNSIAQKPRGTIGLGAEFEFVLVVYSQLICGILIAIGLLTRFSTVPIFIMMAVAVFIAHKNDDFFAKEKALVFLLMTIPVFIFGSGRYSVDRLIFKK